MEPTLIDLMRADADAVRLDPEAANRLRHVLDRKPSELSEREVAHAVARGLYLLPLVHRLVAIVETNPLASAGWFTGDLLKTLIDMPEWVWRRSPNLHQRYRDAVRAGAAARRRLPAEESMKFWSSIPDIDS